MDPVVIKWTTYGNLCGMIKVPVTIYMKVHPGFPLALRNDIHVARTGQRIYGLCRKGASETAPLPSYPVPRLSPIRTLNRKWCM